MRPPLISLLLLLLFKFILEGRDVFGRCANPSGVDVRSTLDGAAIPNRYQKGDPENDADLDANTYHERPLITQGVLNFRDCIPLRLFLPSPKRGWPLLDGHF